MYAYRIGFFICVAALFAPSATAQRYVARTSAPTARSFERLGLERVWTSHVEVDSARGNLTHARLTLSRSEWRTVYEVQFKDKTGNTQLASSFDQRQTDRFGIPIGVERAHKLADIEQRALATRDIEAEIVERRLPSLTLYVQTDRGSLQAIDAETGRTKSTFSVGSPNYPALAPGANDRYAATVNGSTVYVFDMKEDKLKWQKRLGSAPGSGPAVTKDAVYIPLLNGVVRGYRLEDGSSSIRLRSIGRPMVQPETQGDSLCWPTDRGYLYFVNPTSNEMLFRLETNSEVLGNVAFLEPDKAVATTSDGHAYAIDRNTGEQIWQVSAGDTIKKPAVVLGDRAYIVSAMGELHAVDGESGRVLWYAQGVDSVVAGSSTRVFAIGLHGELMAIDRESGARLASSPANYDIQIANPYTDRIYLGTKQGSIVCLRTAGQDTPSLHNSIPELEMQSAGASGSESGDSEAADSATGDSDTGGDDADTSPDDATLDDQPLEDGSTGADPFAEDDSDPFAEESESTDDAESTESDPFADDGSDPFADDSDASDDAGDESDPFADDGSDPFADDGDDTGGDDGGDPFAEDDPFGI